MSVKATKNRSGKAQFNPKSDLWNGSGKFVFHKDKHAMRKQDYHLIEFVLDDHTDDGLRFPTIPHDAMWVERVDDPANPRCPSNAADSDYSVIEPLCVCDEGQRLIVRNDNPREEEWSFTLNLVKARSGEPVLWDPIIQNNNRGS